MSFGNKAARFLSPILLGVIGTFLALATGFLVWLDNQQSFRDGGNVATLMGSVFSFISTSWLISTVLMQKQELALQRKEIALQRFETRRLSDSSELQMRVLGQQEITDAVQRFVDRTGGWQFEDIYSKLCESAKSEVGVGDVIRVEFLHRHIIIYSSETSKTITNWKGVIGRSNICKLSSTFAALIPLASEALKLGLADWWSTVLIWGVKPPRVRRSNGARSFEVEVSQDIIAAALIGAMESVEKQW